MTAWHALAASVILIGPAQRRAGFPAWRLPEDSLVHAGWGGLSYLMAAVLYSVATTERPEMTRTRRLLLAALSAALSFAPPFLLARAIPALAFSRWTFGSAGGIACVSLGTLALLKTAPRFLLALPAAAVAALVVQGRSLGATPELNIDTQFYALRIQTQRAAPLDADTLVEGGGLTRLDDGLLLVTGAGRFAQLTRGSADTAWRIRPLDIPSPANAARFAADAPAGTAVTWFRVVDILAEHRGDSIALTVTHHHWDFERKCTTLRVSEALGDRELRAWSTWRTLFDSRPCLPLRSTARGLPFAGSAAGGRMLRMDERRLLVTVGDHQSDGLNAPEIYPQDSASDYGHTVVVSDDGTSRSFSLGHRNPQGLARDSAGRIWSTEHGPRGGDEVNLVVDGANYGWPWRTHGVEYSLRRWPSLRAPDSAWKEPAFAFVPSRGISNLIAVRSSRFPDWNGDLLVGTLRARELLRLRLDGDRVVYVEAIRVGFELRDLEETADGSIVAWTDQGALLTIRPDDRDDTGAVLAAQCAGCHTLNAGQQGALGPNLYAVLGRSVASVPGYSYSPALRALGGRWTPERLDQYLANPSRYAPGNRMGFAGIKDSSARRALIDYLRASFRR